MFSKEAIEKYYLAEKNLGLLLLIVGIISLIACVIFFFVMKTNFHKGAAIPFLLIGLFQLYLGSQVYKTSDKQRIAAIYAYDMDPQQLKEKELPGMVNDLKSMNRAIIIEAVLMIAGIGLFLYFKKDATKLLWAGLGIALAIEVALCLFVEINIKTKTADYIKGLKEFVAK